MNDNTFGKWLFGLSLLAYLLVPLWGVNHWWNLVPCFTAAIAMAFLDDKFFSKTTLVLWGSWIIYTFIVNLFFY